MAIPSFPPFYFPPHSIEAREFNRKGISVLYVENLAKQVNFPIQIVLIPYARISSSLEKGEIDGAIMFKNEDAKNKVQYIGPVSSSKVVIFPEKNRPIRTYQDLHTLNSIAVVRGANFDNRFDNDEQLDKYFVRDYTQGVKMFKRKRAEGIIGALEGLDYSFRKAGVFETDHGEPVYLSDKETWLHVSNNSSYAKQTEELSNAVEHLYAPYLFYSLYASELENNALSRIGDITLIK
ncbi:transporter substrate-binding domain-containing protein [Alteromonas sp. 5E99-2]|uniref:substrate-binding periplasmic protein n=1 Tax=Alteromonas sp. 5E99-2 TaxID=2817683 RepID=UPI001A99D428|nr:transporter substrate-binding domain-containing protein [Alteromonas sp. 5E99-2]